MPLPLDGLGEAGTPHTPRGGEKNSGGKRFKGNGKPDNISRHFFKFRALLRILKAY